mgnify:CR=1 FL=1|tara:strand:+ start:37 stop:957 length:921 start_codon:yes stop_codon:yes gene_type:complete
MVKILITEFINKYSLYKLKKVFKVHYDEELWKYPNKIIKIINDFDCLIVRNKTIVNKNLLHGANKIRLVGRLGVGLDNIDSKFCYSKKIRIQPATGMNADSVAEYVGTCSLSLIKNIFLFHEGTLKDNWPRTSFSSNELKGKNLGVIGYGTIGKKVSEYCSKIGLKILLYDKYLNKFKKKKNFHFTSLPFLLKNSDIISLHVPLNKGTKNLINKNSFIKMEKKPIIINTSRGSIINEKDLIDAYNKNLISGFALDVFENEPIQSKFLKKIKKNMNCILTPHISGVTYQSNLRVSNFIVDKVINFFN